MHFIQHRSHTAAQSDDEVKAHELARPKPDAAPESWSAAHSLGSVSAAAAVRTTMNKQQKLAKLAEVSGIQDFPTLERALREAHGHLEDGRMYHRTTGIPAYV